MIYIIYICIGIGTVAFFSYKIRRRKTWQRKESISFMKRNRERKH